MLSALATNARLGLLRPSAFGAAPPQCVSSRPRPCENKKLFPEILILAICVRPIRSESNHARVFPSFLCSRFNEREFSHSLDPEWSMAGVRYQGTQPICNAVISGLAGPQVALIRHAHPVPSGATIADHRPQPLAQYPSTQTPGD